MMTDGNQRHAYRSGRESTADFDDGCYGMVNYLLLFFDAAISFGSGA